jgi:hypothetical protein
MRSGFWGKCRVCVRWFRRALIVATLAVICIFLWLNRVGLPDFLKARLVGELQSRGVELEFTRMRLSLVRGLVADNVRIGNVQTPGSPALSLKEVQLQLDYPAMLRRQLQVDGLVLRRGELIWPVSPTDNLVFEQIQTDLRFQTNDTWSLDNFHAEFAGAQINLSGEIAHAPEIRDWGIFQGRKFANRPAQLQFFLDALARIHFDGSPQLSLTVNGDARAIHSIIVRFAVSQARTQLVLEGGTDDAADNYHWRARGALDPEFIRPFLAMADAGRGLDILTFSRPVYLDAAGCGHLDSLDTVSANARLEVTNFMVRGETFGDVTAELNYTNHVLEFFNPLMHTGAQMMTADSVTLDFNTRMIYFTNGFATADPEPIARAIGPKIGRIIEPYHFLEPPTARVNGRLPLHDMKDGRDVAGVDMTFDIIKGAPFEWMKFKTRNITGTIHWQAQTLLVTNVAAEFYGGTGNGFALFDFDLPHEGADYEFTADITNVDLRTLTANLTSLTNHLEGTLAGQLVVTRADSRDWRTWDGFGRAQLRDGLIWDVPVFGILSPVLNMVSPGLGSSRATEASAKFTITNGVISTGSLEIRTTMAQLQYVGNVDFAGNVDMRVSALLLRNAPVIGWWVSLISSPFTRLLEYHVTGTLENPESEPVYVPKFLLMPLHPIRSLEEMFPAPVFTNFTNAPAGG